MVIANPIFDTSFKCILENNKAAKFLIGTILGCKVISLVPGNPEFPDPEDDDAPGAVSLLRMDFTATIVSKEEGERLVIIEMQKSRTLSDVYRFKRYLGKQYRKSKLPIISIYILGFELPLVESPAFVADHECRDLRTNEPITVRSEFVTQLTHRAYFIQTTRIKPSVNTAIDKLLTVFEQANFVGDGTRTKDFNLEIDDPEIKELLGILQYVAADKKTRKKLEEEEENQRCLDGIFGKKDEKIAKQAVVIAETKEELVETKEKLAETKEELAETKDVVAQQAEALAKQSAEIEALKKQLETAKK